MTLGDKQAAFTDCFSRLIVWANRKTGVRLRYREVGRYQWVADEMARQGKGVRRSTHVSFCGGDAVLDLLVDGRWVYQTSSEAYRFLGEKWETMHELARWGGRFARRDGNHFSFEHNGVK